MEVIIRVTRFIAKGDRVHSYRATADNGESDTAGSYPDAVGHLMRSIALDAEFSNGTRNYSIQVIDETGEEDWNKE